jgi:cytochrome b subunit of formate dehydrogenase
MKGSFLARLRRLHLYLGVFFSPLLLLFIVTGWWQTVTINRNKGLGFGRSWIERLSTIHIDQYYPATGVKTYSTLGFKYLVIAMSIGLILTLLLGLVLAFRSSKNKTPVVLALLAGVAVPVLLLFLGQHHIPAHAEPAKASSAMP